MWPLVGFHPCSMGLLPGSDYPPSTKTNIQPGSSERTATPWICYGKFPFIYYYFVYEHFRMFLKITEDTFVEETCVCLTKTSSDCDCFVINSSFCFIISVHLLQARTLENTGMETTAKVEHNISIFSKIFCAAY